MYKYTKRKVKKGVHALTCYQCSGLGGKDMMFSFLVFFFFQFVFLVSYVCFCNKIYLLKKHQDYQKLEHLNFGKKAMGSDSR